MINLILASEMTGADIFICIFLLLIASGIMFSICYGIYKVVSCTKNHANAKKYQRLMFNQLKKDDYVWEVKGEEINEYVVTNASHYFDKNNICKEVVISLQNISSSWSTRQIDIPVDESQTYKYHDYYTIYDEARVLQMGIKLKRDKQRNAVKEVTNEKLVEETTKLIERLNNIKKDYL